jgi:hypothetical protein
MRSSTRRGWQALGIGFGIKLLLLVVEALTRTPPIPGHSSGYPRLFFLHLPSFIAQIVAQSVVPIMWSLHPIALQAISITADVLCYSAIAYLILRWRSARKSTPAEPDAVFVEPSVSPRRTRSTPRMLLALAAGLAVAGTSFALQQIMLTRAVPNGQETLSIDEAYPSLMTIGFPGVVFLILAINLTPVMWGSHPVAAQVVVSTGNFLFYSLVAYVLLRVTTALSAGWRRQ